MPERRYWWVNQGQTFQEESQGGYLWSPKRNKDGRRNHCYECMREIAPGDLIFSYSQANVAAISIATSFVLDSPKPAEFGKAGTQWNDSGWRINADYQIMQPPLSPKSHMDQIRPLLRDKWAPLSQDGSGLQRYLVEIDPPLVDVLTKLLEENGNEFDIEPQIQQTTESFSEDQNEAFEETVVDSVENDSSIDETVKKSMLDSRRGQGKFRNDVLRIENKCRITSVNDSDFLIASHIKPWAKSDNAERLDGNNGLMLTPNADKLFDRGFISFDDGGNLLISPTAPTPVLLKLGIPVETQFNTGPFSVKQRAYLQYHRDEIFKKAQHSDE